MRLMTAKEVAIVMQVPLARVYELARLNLIPSVRIGRQIRFNETKLKEWIEQGGSVMRNDEVRDAA